MLARHTSADVNVIALIGERGREVREFLEKDLGSEGLERSSSYVQPVTNWHSSASRLLSLQRRLQNTSATKDSMSC